MSTNDELSIKGTLSLEDFLMYNKYHSQKFIKIYFIFSFFTLSALLIIQEMPQLLGASLLFSAIVLIPKFILALILSFLVILFVKKIILKRQATKEYESDQLAKTETCYTFSNEGVNQKVRRSNNHYSWSDFQLSIELEEMFLLYVSKRKALVLPKRFFSSNDDIELFKRIVSENMDNSKMKFK